MPHSLLHPVLAPAALALALAAPSSALQAVDIPRGGEPALDGVMAEEEWRDAATIARAGDTTLLAKRTAGTLFLGLRGAGAGITTVGLLAEGDGRLRVLHASASLGTAEYERRDHGEGGSDDWALVRPFSWSARQPPGTAEGDAARAAFRRAEGWLATLASMGADSEIAIDLDHASVGGVRDGARRLRCAVGHLGGHPVRIPADSQDGILGMALQMGNAPATLAAEPSRWLELVCGNAGSTGAADTAAPPPLEGLAGVCAGNAWIYAADAAEAQALAVDAVAAAHDFERYFGRAPPHGAVVAAAGATLPPDVDARLRAAGARWVLPWISTSSPPPGQDDALRAQIEAQLRGQLAPLGVSDEEIAAQLEQVMAQLSGTSAGGPGLLRHELGHVWFISTFWGDGPLAHHEGGHYAGPAPDWLDETAAILLESPETTAGRRASIAEWLDAHEGPDRLMPLEELFHMPHPADTRALLDSVPPEARQGGSVMVLVQAAPPSAAGPDGPGAALDPAAARRFYEQCRLLADYLLERGGEDVFAALAASAARGESVERWLVERGAAFDLPASVTALQTEWLAWVDEEHPGTRAAGPEHGRH